MGASDFDRLVEILKGLESRLAAIETSVREGITIRLGWDKTESADVQRKLDTIIEQGVAMSGELQRLTASVTVIKGKADSLIALVQGLAQLIRDNVGDPAALNTLANQLDNESAAIQSAIDANPLPSDPPPVIGPAAIALPDATVGQPYVASVDVPDASAVSCIIQSGALPDGLSITLEEVSGTPTTAGDYTVVLWHIDEQAFHVGAATTYTIKVVS